MISGLRVLCSLLLALAVFGCGGNANGSAPRMPNGQRIAMMVIIQRQSSLGVSSEQRAQQEQLAQWMESDLVLILRKYGYEASGIAEPNARPGPGRMVLRVRITEFDQANKGSRVQIGHGRGGTFLRTRFELFGEAQPSALVVGETEIGPGGDWRRSALAANLQTADVVNDRLRALMPANK